LASKSKRSDGPQKPTDPSGDHGNGPRRPTDPSGDHGSRFPDWEKILNDVVRTIPVEQAADLFTSLQRWKDIRQAWADANPWIPQGWFSGGGVPPGTGELIFQLARLNIKMMQAISDFTVGALESQFRDIRRRQAGQVRRTIALYGRLGGWARAQVAPRLWNDTSSEQRLVIDPHQITDETGNTVGASVLGGPSSLFAVVLMPPAPKGLGGGRSAIDTPIVIPANSKRAVQIEVHLLDNVFVAADDRTTPPASGRYFADVDVRSASHRHFVVDQLRLEITVGKPPARGSSGPRTQEPRG
jgi:hypothetical protein